MAIFTQVSSATPYSVLLLALFIMGLGMGATMMPTFTAALQTLTHASVARGTTLMNIIQQVSSSIGTATFSVVLTNQIQSHSLAGPAIAGQTDPGIAASLGSAGMRAGLHQAGRSYGATFTIGFVLIACCLIPALFMPRRKPAAPPAAIPASQAAAL